MSSRRPTLRCPLPPGALLLVKIAALIPLWVFRDLTPEWAWVALVAFYAWVLVNNFGVLRKMAAARR